MDRRWEDKLYFKFSKVDKVLSITKESNGFSFTSAQWVDILLSAKGELKPEKFPKKS